MNVAIAKIKINIFINSTRLISKQNYRNKNTSTFKLRL